MTLFQCIFCVIKIARVCNTKLFMYCKQHAQCNIAARRRCLMHIKAVDNQKYIFVPTFFLLTFRTKFCLLKWKKWGKSLRSGVKMVGSGHRNQTIFFHRLTNMYLQWSSAWWRPPADVSYFSPGRRTARGARWRPRSRRYPLHQTSDTRSGTLATCRHKHDKH